MTNFNKTLLVSKKVNWKKWINIAAWVDAVGSVGIMAAGKSFQKCSIVFSPEKAVRKMERRLINRFHIVTWCYRGKGCCQWPREIFFDDYFCKNISWFLLGFIGTTTNQSKGIQHPVNRLNNLFCQNSSRVWGEY